MATKKESPKKKVFTKKKQAKPVKKKVVKKTAPKKQEVFVEPEEIKTEIPESFESATTEAQGTEEASSQDASKEHTSESEPTKSDVLETGTITSWDKELEKKDKPNSKKMWVVIGIIVLGLVFLAITGFVYYTQFANKQAPDEVSLVVSQVGKLVHLPEGETPTLATVSDTSKLENQPFFALAQNGDKVLIYTSAKKAYLYRPSTNKVVEVGPVNIVDEQPKIEQVNATPTEEVEKELEIVLLNGTRTVGLTVRAETDLRDSAENVSVLDRDNAETQDYEETIVVNVSNVSESRVEAIAKIFNAQIESLPEGQTAPDGTDVLVILGSDYAGN